MIKIIAIITEENYYFSTISTIKYISTISLLNTYLLQLRG